MNSKHLRSRKNGCLLELKYNQTVKTAADQIRDRNYPQRLEHYRGKLLLVSINYDREASGKEKEYKRHQCRI